MNFQRTLFANLFKVGIYKYTGEVIALLSSMVISRYVTPGEFGTLAMITIFYSFLMKFSDVGLSEAIIREKANTSFGEQAQILFLIKGVVLALIMVGLTFPISWFFKHNELIPIGLSYGLILFLYSLPKARIALLRKQELYTAVARIEFFVVLIQVGLSVSLAILGFSYWSLVLPHLISPFFYVIFLKRYNQAPIWPNDLSNLKNMWASVSVLFMSLGVVNFMQYWQERIDSLWVGKIYGTENLGLYNKAYSLSNLPVALISPQLNSVLLSSFSKGNFEKKQIRLEVKKLHGLLFSISFIPFAVFFLYPETVSIFLWGKEWAGVGKYLGLLCFAFYWQLFIQSTHTIYLLFRNEKMLMLQTIISGSVLMLLISLGVFTSIEVMIYYFLSGLLFVAVPLTFYLGLFKCLEFRFIELIKSYGLIYVVMISLLILKMANLSEYDMYILGLLAIYSVVTLRKYIKSLIVG